MGVTRLHTPTTDEPLIVVLVDEITALTGWITDRTMKKRIESALSLLLTQGRAVGVVVLGAIQDPRKDVIPQRDLLSIRIGLRVNEADVRLSLGSEAYNRGAADISATTDRQSAPRLAGLFGSGSSNGQRSKSFEDVLHDPLRSRARSCATAYHL